MTEIIVAVLGITLLLYVLLGGADFGAGIIELFIGKKGISAVSKAIAPVWEANHVWIILAVVILFNAFPLAYTVVSTYLHIPLLLLLIGIIIRGTAFSFRYYDVMDGNVQNYYSWFFRISSLITPLFLGIVLGAVIMGRIPSSPHGSFYDSFIYPWLNWFTFTTGLFITLLFSWLAAVYLIGEVTSENFRLFSRTAYILFAFLIFSGLLVFLVAEWYNIRLFSTFRKSPVSITCVVIATLSIPFMIKSIAGKKAVMTRFLAGVITACILTGWFAVQMPVMIHMADGNHLTIWNSQAPQKTMYYLMLALLVGSLIIIPAFAYLFRIFKFNPSRKENH